MILWIMRCFNANAHFIFLNSSYLVWGVFRHHFISVWLICMSLPDVFWHTHYFGDITCQYITKNYFILLMCELTYPLNNNINQHKFHIVVPLKVIEIKLSRSRVHHEVFGAFSTHRTTRYEKLTESHNLMWSELPLGWDELAQQLSRPPLRDGGLREGMQQTPAHMQLQAVTYS